MSSWGYRVCRWTCNYGILRDKVRENFSIHKVEYRTEQETDALTLYLQQPDILAIIKQFPEYKHIK